MIGQRELLKTLFKLRPQTPRVSSRFNMWQDKQTVCRVVSHMQFVSFYKTQFYARKSVVIRCWFSCNKFSNKLAGLHSCYWLREHIEIFMRRATKSKSSAVLKMRNVFSPTTLARPKPNSWLQRSTRLIDSMASKASPSNYNMFYTFPRRRPSIAKCIQRTLAYIMELYLIGSVYRTSIGFSIIFHSCDVDNFGAA